MSTYTNTHAKVKNWIFEIQFPGNWFEFGIIGNDFWSSTIWATQIHFFFAEFKNPKIPGIQPNYYQFKMNQLKSVLIEDGLVASKVISIKFCIR